MLATPLSRPGTATAAVSRAAILEAAQVEEESEVYELSLHHVGLRSMLGLSRCVRLRVLDLSFNCLRSIEGLEALSELREVRLYANEIAHVRGLGALPKLQTLLLHDNRLTPEANPGGDGLIALSQLMTLRVDTNARLGSAGLAALRLDHLPSLTELDASSTRLTDASPLGNLRSSLIETLRLAHNELTVRYQLCLRDKVLAKNYLDSGSIISKFTLVGENAVTLKAMSMRRSRGTGRR